jgi:3D (Asp-Asp-Asp) domain-containing protein
MMFRVVSLAVLATSLFLVGCAERSLPEYEPPLKRSAYMKVRTTAYTHTESDHVKYAASSAAGTQLQSGVIRSAAGDWARWPVGTKFMILATGQIYQIDDYGWALAGRNTIDLYCSSHSEMNNWGVRRVTIQILEWGDPWRSYHILKPRSANRDNAHVRRMMTEIKRFYGMLAIHSADFPILPSHDVSARKR